MAIDPQQLYGLTQRVVDHYRDAQLAIVTLLATRVKRGIDTDEWAGRQLADSPRLQRDVRRIVAGLQRHRASAVAEALGAAYGGAGAATARVLERASLKGSIAAAFERSGPSRALATLTRDLEGRLAAGDPRILRVSEDVFRSVIGEATQTAIESGVTRRAAAQAALDRFASRGVTGFITTDGRAMNLASYTEMACRTAVLNASRAGRLDAMRERGHDLAIISGTGSGCQTCAPWEGQIVSLDGATPGYPTLDEAEGDGLFHPNCGHEADAWVPGVTAEQTPLRSDPAMYAARERQRQMERTIRAYKLRKAAALDDAAASRAQAKVREWQGRLREHVAANNLKRLRYREQIGKAI